YSTESRGGLWAWKTPAGIWGWRALCPGPVASNVARGGKSRRLGGGNRFEGRRPAPAIRRGGTTVAKPSDVRHQQPTIHTAPGILEGDVIMKRHQATLCALISLFLTACDQRVPGSSGNGS